MLVFFDDLIPTENMGVIRVVGSVIRYSIGFQAKHGSRRQQATLAYSSIMKASGIASRATLAAAIREAIKKHYIVRLDAGYFSARVSERRSATCAVRWIDGFHAGGSQKIEPADLPLDQSENRTSNRAKRSDFRTSGGQENEPARQSENRTIETKPLNETLKQQAVDLLRKEGFNGRTAATLADGFPLELIAKQIGWLDWRNPTKSRAGLLRRAIEENWSDPQRPQTPAISKELSQRPDPKFEAYKLWLANEEADYRRSFPDDYARFEAKRLREREDIYRERSANVRAPLLTAHDELATRLLHFQRFIGLPDFWQWDAEFNNDKSNSSSS